MARTKNDQDAETWWGGVMPTAAEGKKGWSNIREADSITLATVRAQMNHKFLAQNGAAKLEPLYREWYEKCRERDPAFFDGYKGPLTWLVVRDKLKDRCVWRVCWKITDLLTPVGASLDALSLPFAASPTSSSSTRNSRTRPRRQGAQGSTSRTGPCGRSCTSALASRLSRTRRGWLTTWRGRCSSSLAASSAGCDNRV